MLTIIFGAGASFDSSPDVSAVDPVMDAHMHSNRLPLAKEIFQSRFGKQAKMHKDAQALFPCLRQARDIEKELGKIFDSAKTYPPTYRELLSVRYYIKDVIESAEKIWRDNFIYDISTYHGLLDIVDRWKYEVGANDMKTNLVTFNYDTMLDLSYIAVLRKNLDNVQSYIENDSTYQIFKVHGSIDWLHEVTNVADNIFDSAGKLDWIDNYIKGQIIDIKDSKPVPLLFSTSTPTKIKYVEIPGDLLTIPNGHDYVPAIAIPTETKKNFEFPQKHLERMKAAIKETNALLIIGWRGAEEHFLETWKNSCDPSTLKIIQIVNSDPNKSHEIYMRLHNAGITCNNVRYSHQGFSHFIRKDLAEFLSQATLWTLMSR